MPPGRWLLMLVVLTATLAVHRPASATHAPAGERAERASWARRLGTGVAEGFSRIALMQRVTLRTPAARTTCVRDDARPARTPPDPRLTCLPPPLV